MPPPVFPDSPRLRAAIRGALDEDLDVAGDITAKAIFPPEARMAATIRAKEPAVLCGGPVVRLVYEALDPLIDVTLPVDDGTPVAPGTIVAAIRGPAIAILSGERTALNFIQRLSGIATVTARCVAAAGPAVKVCDTRKTNPGWRHLDKYAVRCGGGTNHRMGLHDMVMIKDTHADACGGLAAALERVAPLRQRYPIAAEARDLGEVRVALDKGVDLLMLDNMPEPLLIEALALAHGRAEVEVTGGITLERLPRLAALGVTRVSSGALTHSARAVDFSMTSAPIP